ncbi:MAG: 50S ribosomal protein L21 [Rhodospirillales bacterium]|nr:50S ribosomal protein L21 [Rhodospirillales bacterium]
MYAVVRTGGKMYRVAEKDRLVVERLPGEAGATVTLGDVLMIVDDGEAPKIGGDVGQAAVFAEILGHKRGKKILVFKKKRRKNYRRTRGHRQALTELRISGISLSGERPAERSDGPGISAGAESAPETVAAAAAAPETAKDEE